ncbi:membrane protein [Streptomyces viridochromogenes]|nr:membrane protein [Streptomyces viridochromogenes]
MWPGQQPPGGEQNPQANNPYQQPGYQQPNPYQQPGYQQPNPYGQQPQWGAPAPAGAPQPPPGGGGGNRTKLVAIIAATAVVVAAGVTGFLVLGGDESDTADGKNDKKPAPTASKKASDEPSASASASEDNPRGGEAEKATIPGWKVVVNTRFGTEFDVPADWEIETPGTSVGFEWEKKDGELDRTTVTAPAYLQSKWCTSDPDKDGRKEDTALVTAGTRGEDGAKTTDEAAETRVPWWIFGGYTQPDKKSVKYSKPKPYTTKSGIKGSVATAHSENTPQNGKCDSEGKAITFAFKNGAGDFVTWNLFGAKGVKDELSEATVQKILSTVRLTKEPPTGN